MAPKVLVADKLSRLALDIFARRGIDAHVRTDLTRDELIEIVPDYDGLAVRSTTKVTEKVVAAADRLKVIGRAGIGVDNVDLKAATARGIIVMNTPFGNAITTAEHAIALMLALARQVPLADVTTRAGKWAKSQLIGVEITGKCLGIIGCGNIGAIVADRARGLKMKVVAFDPYLSPERATDLGVEKMELDALFRRADFITLHTPLTDKPLTAAALSGVLTPFLEQANMISAATLAKERGIMVEEVSRGQEGAYETYIRLRVGTEFNGRSVAGTVFSDGKPRIVQVGDIAMEAELGPHMLYTENADKPGYIGALGTALGAAQMNIATFSLGRSAPGGTAIALLELDQPIPDDLLEKINALPHVTRAERLFF